MTPSSLREVADEVRQIARREARRASPPIERYRVRRVKPLRLEAFGSELLLDEDDDDLALGRGLRKLMKQGDVAYVARERDGDYVILGVTSPTGGANEEEEDASGARWFVGEGVPAPGLGDDGDFYLRSTNGDVYKKTAGAWEIVANIRGPKGDAGADGADGADGKDGAPGVPGKDGEDGAPGSEWFVGAGVPEEGLGIDGDLYLRTSNGDVYEKVGGAWGIVGNLMGPEGKEGKEGKAGGAGAEGRWAGLRYRYLTATTNSDPGAGNLKLNLFKTILRISETDADGGALAALIATFDDSTTLASRGYLTLRKIGTPATFAVYKITGALEDPGAYDNLPVELVSSGGAFANEDVISVEFSRTGDAGAEGAKGAEGTKGGEGAAGKGIIACRLVTAAGLAAYTRTANKLEANANGALATIDGVAPAVGDYVLLKDGASAVDNGPYKVLSLGAVGAKWSMERVPEFDTSAEAIPGMLFTVSEGNKHADSLWQLTTNGTIILNTTALAFARSPVVPAARGQNSAAIAVATGAVGTPLTFNQEKYDNAEIHSTAEQTSRFKAPITGIYDISAGAVFASNAVGIRALSLVVNGATIIAVDMRAAINGEQTMVTIASSYKLNAGDYVEVWASQTSGGNLNVQTLADYSPHLEMNYRSPA